MSMFWRELRTSRLRWTVAPLTALGLAIIWLRDDFWIGVWPETGAAAQIPAFHLALLAAGIAAWESNRPHRHRITDITQAAAISQWRLEAGRIGAAATWLLLPYAVAASTALAATAPANPPGLSMALGYIAIGAVLILLGFAWGWACGRLFGTALAVIAAFTGWFLIIAYPLDESYVHVISGPAMLTVDAASLTLRLTAALVLVASLAVLPRARPTRITGWTAAVVPLTAAVAAAAVVLATPGVKLRDVQAETVCVAGRIEICIWPEHEKYLPTVQRAVDDLASLPAGFAYPERLVELGLAEPDHVAYGSLLAPAGGQIFMPEGSRWGLAMSIASEIGATTFDGCDWDMAMRNNDLRMDQLIYWLQIHLAGGGDPDYRTEPNEHRDASWAAARHLADMPTAAQHHTITTMLADIDAIYCQTARS